MPKIAFYDVHEIDQAAFRAALGADFELVQTDAGLNAENVALAQDAQVVSIHVTSPVTAEIMAGLPQLKLVACRSTGFDHVDLEYAKAHGIVVVNVPAYGTETVAEYAFMLMLAVSRRLMQSALSVQGADVTPEKLTGWQLSGKTLGVIGTGRIGQHAAVIGKGFGMKVVGYDAYPQAEAAARIGFEYRSLDEVLSEADYLTLHAPATPETHHMLGAAQFAKMKTGVQIVNTARGSLIDTTALLTALKDGRVAGAGLDVLEGEDHLGFTEELHLLSNANMGEEARQVLGIELLQNLPNVLITSHNAYNSYEALEIIRHTTATNILAWNKGKLENPV